MMNPQWITYFAYGSNMSALQLKQRCADSFLVGTGYLPGHRVVMNGRNVATVIPDPHHDAWGVIALMTPGDLTILDGYEGLDKGNYVRETRKVTVKSGDYELPCEVYIATDDREGYPPRPGYLERILYGARRHELAPAYIAYLESLAHGTRSDA